jgi:hypothetical protein
MSTALQVKFPQVKVSKASKVTRFNSFNTSGVGWSNTTVHLDLLLKQINFPAVINSGVFPTINL